MKAAMDLCLRPRSVEELEEMIGFAATLGYRAVAVEIPQEQVFSPGTVRRIGEKYGLEVYTRITLRPETKRELLAGLSRAEKRYDVIAVRTRSPEVIRHAARDGRVNLVSLASYQARYMDRSEADLLRQGGGGVEVWFSELLGAVENNDYRRIRGFEAIIRRAVGYSARIVVPSCAKNKWGLRSPSILVAVLVSTGIPLTLAKTIVYSYPYAVLG